MKNLEGTSTAQKRSFELDELKFDEPSRNSKLKYICFALYAIVVYSFIELYGVDFYKHIICVEFFKSIGMIFVGHVAINMFNITFRAGIK